MSENSINEMSNPKIAVVGIGGAGCDMINGIIDLGVKYVKFVAIDTEDDVSLAKWSTLADRNIVIIVGDMDDKTVCNVAPSIAEIAQYYCGEKQVMAIVTATVMDGIDELKRVTNSVLVVPMHKIFSTTKDGALIENAFEAFCLIVKTIVDVIVKCNDIWKVCYNCKNCRTIAEVEDYLEIFSHRTGGMKFIDDGCVWNELEKYFRTTSYWGDSYASMFGFGCQTITKTYGDIMKTFCRGAGTAAVSTARAGGVFYAIKKACETPFWDNVSIASSLSVLVVITASEKVLREWNPCFLDVENLICGNKNTVVIFCEIIDFAMGDEVEVTIVAADFENRVVD